LHLPRHRPREAAGRPCLPFFRDVVGEYERTISEVISERERNRVCHDIDREKLQAELEQVRADFRSAEVAFNDVHRKYERTKDVISGFVSNEATLKRQAEDLRDRVHKGEERFEILKTHAESKLTQANTKLDETRRSGTHDITKLEAQLKKAEMRVGSLERTMAQKTQENKELTAICDELIDRVGK
jgi:chromosome segregation ATPase